MRKPNEARQTISIFTGRPIGDNPVVTVPIVRLPHIVEAPAAPPERRPEHRRRLWLRRMRTRRQLADLDAERLRDVGLTPAERAAECAKWFWEP